MYTLLLLPIYIYHILFYATEKPLDMTISVQDYMDTVNKDGAEFLLQVTAVNMASGKMTFKDEGIELSPLPLYIEVNTVFNAIYISLL